MNWTATTAGGLADRLKTSAFWAGSHPSSLLYPVTAIRLAGGQSRRVLCLASADSKMVSMHKNEKKIEEDGAFLVVSSCLHGGRCQGQQDTREKPTSGEMLFWLACHQAWAEGAPSKPGGPPASFSPPCLQGLT